MSRRSFRSDELMRYQVSWAEQIAAKDTDYRDYAGADEMSAFKLAKIDLMLFLLPQDHTLIPLLKLARIYLIQRKKAFFASVKAGELSQLGFIKGGKPFDIRAKLAKFK